MMNTPCTAASPGPCCSYTKRPDNVIPRSNAMNGSNIKFMHYRDLSEIGNILPQGGTTVAYEETETGTRFAFAKCSPYDNYNKAYGRAKAAGRLRAVGKEALFCSSSHLKGADFRNFLDREFMGEYEDDAIPF